MPSQNNHICQQSRDSADVFMTGKTNIYLIYQYKPSKIDSKSCMLLPKNVSNYS